MNEKLTEAARAYIKELYKDAAGSHDEDHTLRVYKNAMLIAEAEPSADRELVEIASLLHDADDPKLFDTEDNANARAFLSSQGVPGKRTERIISIINSVSFSRNKDRKPEDIESMIVQDADRLDAMGAVGIARTFAYGGEKGRSLNDSVEHFYDKLLKLKELMNTGTGRKLAEERHGFLIRFLEEYKRETV